MSLENCSRAPTFERFQDNYSGEKNGTRRKLTSDIAIMLKITEFGVLTLVVQAAGIALLISSLFTFIKHRLLLKKENIYQICVLVSNSMVLLLDWSVFTDEYARCDVFSMAFLVSGTASTLSSLAIAWDRFWRMSRLFDSSPRKSQYVVGILLICILSASTTVLPLHSLAQSRHGGQQLTSDTLCFLKDGLLHSTLGPSLYFTIVSVILPTIGMLVCYMWIFRGVRNARINRWINQASAEANRKALLIKANGRKANIVALPSEPVLQRQDSSLSNCQTAPPQRCPSEPSSTTVKERSILFKAVLSVLLVIFWFPFAAVWLMTAFSGFKESFVNHIQRFILLAKLTSVLRILHYIVLNPKYRVYFSKTVCSPCTNRIHTLNTQNESNVNTDISRNNRMNSSKDGTDKPLYVIKTNLETIREISASKQKQTSTTTKTHKKTQVGMQTVGFKSPVESALLK